MKFNIIKNNQTTYHIVHSVNSHEAERYAGMELQKYIYLAANTLIPVFSDKCMQRSKEIILGDARANSYKNILKDKSTEAYLIKEDSENIYITGNSPRAILYGVYKFLELFIGFRCYAKDCEKYDTLNDLAMEEGFSYIGDFSFEYREAYFTDAFNGDFAAKNMLNSNLADLSNKHGNKVKWFNFHHSFSDLINPLEYFDTHPEYFSLIDGKRVKIHTELCLSNKDVFNLCLDKLRTWIINNPECDIFSVAQDEWMGHFTKMACECENCKKIDEENNSQSGSIITFVNKLATALQEEFPNKLIHTFAYQYSRKTPTKVIPHKNIIVRLCNIECSWSKSIEESAANNPEGRDGLFLNDLKNWSKISNHLYIWDYAVNFRNYLLPFPNLRTMAKNIELYRKMNVKGILMQGNFSYGGKGYLDELKSYLTARLLRDDTEPLNDLIKDFCDHYYGVSSSNYIIDYINMWEDEIYDKTLWLYDDADSELFTDELIEKGTKLLQLAYVNATNDIYKERIEKLMLGMEYAYIVRLPLEAQNRNELIDKFYEKIKKHHITEIMERTSLEFSINVMKNSRYAKERPNWYSLYYIMK
ncbi:MAG: DUF4838 domain-containing protein [Bacilli bacterium]|nr:DUF4838 domain-containing protein [Bacilli bacterium]